MKKTKNIERKQILRGRVVSAKLPKTVTVLVENIVTHPLYMKSYRRSKKYLVHNVLGATLGDVVEIIKVMPLSKNKHFKVSKIVGKDIEAVVSEQLKEETEKIIAEAMPEGKQSSVLSDQLSDESQSVVGKPETRKLKTDNRRSE